MKPGQPLKRTSELKRTGQLKSNGRGLARTKLRRTARKQMKAEEKARAAEFKASVYGPTAGTCAVCGFMSTRRDDIKAHHVVYHQHCPPGYEWDTRNAMAVCRGCHGRHHDGSDWAIPHSCLTPGHREFAREVGLEWRLDRHYPRKEV